MNRRRFLQASAVSSLLVGAGCAGNGERRAWGGGGSGGEGGGARGRAKNVIFLVSDGMSTGTLTMADQFLRWRDGETSNWISYYEKGVGRRGLMDMQSASSIVTDSAAAAASWGCGHRVVNGYLNIGENDEHHVPILMTAREAGKSTGLVTTTTVTHATPAGFASNVPNRGMEEEIAGQYLEREYDIILGGGRRFFEADGREDGRDLIAGFREKGYRTVRTTEGLRGLSGDAEKVVGLFTSGHVPYELDRVNSERQSREVPSLAEMADAAITRLSRNPEGFVLQIEGGRVDHAAHGNDIGGLIFDQIAFDEAVGRAVRFAEEDGETLVIVTTDHGNANPGLNSGNDEGERNFTFIQNLKGTHGPILSGIDSDSGVDDIRDRVEQIAGIELEREHAELLQARLRGEYRAMYGRMNGMTAVLGQVLANYIDIGWVGNSHTSDYVEVWGYGPGSEMVQPFNKNTDMHAIMLESTGMRAVHEGQVARL